MKISPVYILLFTSAMALPIIKDFNAVRDWPACTSSDCKALVDFLASLAPANEIAEPEIPVVEERFIDEAVKAVGKVALPLVKPFINDIAKNLIPRQAPEPHDPQVEERFIGEAIKAVGKVATPLIKPFINDIVGNIVPRQDFRPHVCSDETPC